MRYQNGDSIGEYVIVGHLGSGGSGDVFRVEHSITGRLEAMKILPSGLDEQRAERILREAKLQARLDHPNITAVHHAFWWNGALALVMELVEGESLRTLIERGPVPYETALALARQILRALDHAHRRQVIHRDITPANILLTSKGVVKLTDFGLAKEPADRKITQSGTMMGSVHYCSPEQIRSSADVDSRTDIYSCGAVLYEMFVGRKPFEADNSFDLMLAQAEAVPDPPSKVNTALPARLDQCLLRAMHKDPQQRFSTAADFLSALERTRPTVPASAYAIAAFATVALLLAALTVRWPDQSVVPPPPMPSVAIRIPPLPLPVATLPTAPPSEEPVQQAVLPPAPVSPPKLAPKQKPRPSTAQVVTPLRPAAPMPLGPTAPRETSPPRLAVQAKPFSPPPVTTVVDGPPPETAEPSHTEERPGFLKGVVRHFNIFHKRNPSRSQ